MAITKLGEALTKTGGVTGGIATGALWAAFPAMGVASGEQSVGEAVGETVGGFGGFELGRRVYNKFVPEIQAPGQTPWYKRMMFWQKAPNTGGMMKRFGRGLGGFVASGIVGAIGGHLGGSALGAALPVYKRKQPTGQDYFNS